MNTVVEVSHLTKRYGATLALDDVNLALEKDVIYGLLGRNGAGKTTLMSMITAQGFPTSGRVAVYGEEPYENARALRHTCFVRENQKYPDGAKVGHALAMARLFFGGWDQGLAERLAADFRLPLNRHVRRLSRGQLSAVGVIIGMAARAEITFFDEPYLGLDAAARQVFYDRLLEDYADHPRTIVLSSHLIDEVASLLERIVVLDEGRVVMNEAADEVRGRAVKIVGDAAAVAAFTAGREVIHTERLGRVVSATVLGPLSAGERAGLAAAGLETAPVSLQQLIVHTTGRDRPTAEGRIAV